MHARHASSVALSLLRSVPWIASCGHEASGDIGTVDRGLGRTRASEGFLSTKQCGGIVPARRLIGCGQDAYDLRRHAAVAEEGDQVVGGIPDQPPGDNAVNAAEQRITDFQAASEAIRYGVDVDSAVDAPTDWRGC